MERPSTIMQTSVLPFFDTSHALNLLRGIYELREEQKFFDMTLSVEGRDFPCHRTILASASKYFKAMFAGTLKESFTDRVEIHDVSADILGLLIDFCYTGRVAVTQDNVDLLLQAADLFQFHSVKEACCLYLEQHLDVSNCLEIQDFAEAFACRSLAENTKCFILNNIVELAKGKEFEKLSRKRILEYITDDRLCVDKEETAYQIALRWVKADVKRRQHFWPELFEHVRLPFIRRFYLLAYVESDPLVYYSPPCLKLISEARTFQSYEYDRHDYPCKRMRPRPSTGLAEILVVIGGCDQDCDELVTVDCYNPHTGQWRYLAEFPDHLGGGYSITALGNDIYVTGGSDGSRLYDGVWRYNSSVNEWTEVSPMLKAREYHSSTVLKGMLYVVASDSTERYDHTIDTWEALLPMLYPMDNCSTTACHGKLYAIGSLADKEAMVIQCYDLETDRWSLVNCGKLPPWTFAPKTVTLNGLLYFVRDDSAEVDAYSPLTNKWDRIPPMTQVHVGGSVAALGGKLFVSGGYDNTYELSDVVEAFDPQTRSWSVVGHLPQPTFWHGSVSIFRQFMPQAQYGFEGIDNPELNAINLHRQPRLELQNQNLHMLN
ncbi:kelch-like protein 21 [Latimeria chalumnae]|uniref:Kelch-like protein 21 n=1 Tax=Latimeria chalumnae TaxID=7897 RepID=H3B7U6_LATCH|nr:PREDICTED: kelch-like protein 21 [Latimeria chalumnae]XP_005994257.1 PREDICTED: kelch-like protein 21 [Latimeria chalumnae]XP_014342837.1 PREDICTED: kelch-like protein 21 [Latimeria chalumnae]|eukprot:XP_005994256.1 PREDICTED: kelch-like protein 21 [Latimeria chalumnae]